MIPVSSKIKAAFQSDSMFKTYYLVFLNSDLGIIRIDNTGLSSDGITLTEPMCSEEQLHYGRCEAATFEFEMKYVATSLVGQIFDVYLVLGDYFDEEDIFTVGRYIVDTEDVENDRSVKTVTAFDIMYVLNHLDITYWMYQLNFPITIKNFRDSLFEYVGQEQVEVELINDNAVLYQNPLDNQTDISFEAIMTGLCEVNGVFGHINREGKFDYKSLTAVDSEETYPGKATYPGSDLFPKSMRGKNYFINPHLIVSDISWSNYMCKTVDIVQARNSAGKVVLEYQLPNKTTNTNIYVIQNNWIIDAFENATLNEVIRNFAEFISKITYMPVDANVKMDLSFEVGDAITLTSTDGTRIPTFIFSRTMTGIVSAFDNFVATGYEEFINEAPSSDGAIEEIASEVSDLDDRVTALEGGDGNIQILSVKELPSAPRKNVLYLVQGKIYVN